MGKQLYSIKKVDSFQLVSVIGGDRGIWSNSLAYLPNSTAYKVELEGFKGSSDQLKELLLEVDSDLSEVAIRGNNRNLPWYLDTSPLITLFFIHLFLP